MTLFLTIRQLRQSLIGDTQTVQHTLLPPSPHPLTPGWPLYLLRVCIVLRLKTRRKEPKSQKNVSQKSEDHDVEPAFCSSLAIFFPGFCQDPNPMTPLN